MPVWGVLIRLGIYIPVGIAAVTLFRPLGAPVIAAGELSISVEAVFMLIMLNRRLAQPIRPVSALLKGLLAALLGGVVTYALALYLPGPGYITALAGMAAGTALALVLVWSETKQLLHL